jgi:phage gpG-like protein
MIDLAGAFRGILEPIIGRVQHARAMYARIGQIMVSEFKKNIETGRPPQWPQSKAALKRHGTTLRLTGRLMNSYASNPSDGGVSVGPTAPYAVFLANGVTRYPRSETFMRERIGRGIHRGRFKASAPASRRTGHGFTFREYSFGPWDLFYLPQDAMERIKGEVAAEVTR